MTTALGGVSGSPFTIPVRSTETSILIGQGQVVSLEPHATAPNYLGAEQMTIDVKQGGASSYVNHCGVACTSIPAGYVGTIQQIGPILCQTTSTAINGSVAVKVTANSYTLEAYAASGTKIGVTLEPNHVSNTGQDYGTATNKFAYCWVNFMSDLAFGYT